MLQRRLPWRHAWRPGQELDRRPQSRRHRHCRRYRAPGDSHDRVVLLWVRAAVQSRAGKSAADRWTAATTTNGAAVAAAAAAAGLWLESAAGVAAAAVCVEWSGAAAASASLWTGLVAAATAEFFLRNSFLATAASKRALWCWHHWRERAARSGWTGAMATCYRESNVQYAITTVVFGVFVFNGQTRRGGEICLKDWVAALESVFFSLLFILVGWATGLCSIHDMAFCERVHMTISTSVEALY